MKPYSHNTVPIYLISKDLARGQPMTLCCIQGRVTKDSGNIPLQKTSNNHFGFVAEE